MKRRVLILAAALILTTLGLLGWWIAASGPPAAGDEGAGSSRAAEVLSGSDVDRRSGRSLSFGRREGALTATAVEDGNAGAGVLEGVVLSWETNEPVVGAEITFAHGESVSSAMTNLGGGFEFRAGEPGAYELAAVTAEGFLPFAPEWGHSSIRLEARPGLRIRDIVIHLRPAVELEGRVVDPEGRPVPGAEVVVLSASQGQSALAPMPDRFVTDDRGAFDLQSAPWALLEARREGFAPGRARVDGPARRAGRLEIRLRPGEAASGEGAMIAGRVLDADGRPVEGALVASAPMFNRRRLANSAQALTDEGGEFLLEGLDRGRYTLRASAGGWAPGLRPGVPTGVEDVEIRLRRGALLRGTVINSSSGEPVPGFSIMVQANLGGIRRRTARTEAFFDAEGDFEITGLEPRVYDVVASSHGYARSEPVTVTLREGDEAEVDLSLGRGGSARGRVTDEETGAPVVDAQISLEAAGSRRGTPVPVTARTVTDSGGDFELHGLTPGRRSLSVVADGYHRRLVTGLEVDESGELGPLTVELTPTAEGEDPGLELTGIGAVLSPRRTSLVIVRVVDTGGAAEVGLVPGDAVLWVDGQQVIDLGFTGAIERIRGPEGTTVRLTVRRASGEEVEFTVPRRRIRS